jgi:hypothetical protein
MGNISAPELGHGSKIYRMARDRNFKVLITSLAVFIFGSLSLYDGIVRPQAQTPAGIVINFLIIGISFYGFYLFLTRNRDVFRNPDVNKFLSLNEPQRYLDLFEQEFRDGSPKSFRNGFVTRNFIVTQTFYRFRWAHSSEITMAYVEPAKLSFHRIPLPFLGISTVMIHLGNGTTIHINCESKEEAETLLKMIARMAPSARYTAPVREKNDPSAAVEASARDVAATIRQMPDLPRKDSPVNETKGAGSAFARDINIAKPAVEIKKIDTEYKESKVSPRSGPGTAVKPGPAQVRQMSKEEAFESQIKNLYDTLEKEEIAQSVTIIDLMGDTMNLAATEILEILLEYTDESVRIHAAFALGKLGQRSSLEALISALDDPSAQVRENAAIALGKIGDQRAVAPLQQVSTADVRTKKAAVGALARIDQKLGIYNQPGSDWRKPFFSSSSDDR